MNPSSSGSGLGLASVAAAAALWAVAAAVASDLLDGGVDPIEMAQARAVVASAGLVLLGGRWNTPADRAPGSLVALGLSIALINASYYVAIDRLPIAVAIVFQYVGPALVVSWVALTARRRPSNRVLVALVAALGGVVLVSGIVSGVDDRARADLLGVTAGLASAVFFATYTLLSEKVAARYGPLGALRRAFPIAAIFWIAFQLPRGFPHALVTAGNLPRILFIGIAGTLAPFFLYLWGVQRVRSERASIAATLEPVIAAVVAWIWLGQELGPLQLAGGALVIAAVVFLQWKPGPRLIAPEA